MANNTQSGYSSPLLTQDLLKKGRNLINHDYNKENISSLMTKYRTPASNKKHTSVLKTRQKIRKEWQNLKDKTVLSDDSLLGHVLYGTVIYIEIDSEQREINALRDLLKKMGATVQESFTQEVTHIIFHNGSIETYKRAKLLNVHLVSTLWVDACRNSKTKIWESLFPTADFNNYSHTPGAFKKFMEFYDSSNGQQHSKSLANIMKDLRELDLDVDDPDHNEADSSGSIHLRVSTPLDSSKEKSINDATADVTNLNIVLETETCETESPEEVAEDISVPQEEILNFNNTSADADVETSYNSTDCETISPNRRKLFTKHLREQSFIRNSQASQKTSPLKNPYRGTTGENIIKKVISPNKTKVVKKAINKEVIKIVTNEQPKQQQFTLSQFYTFSKFTQMAPSLLKPSLVSTSLHCHENRKLKEIITQLGVFNFKPRVDHHTTHIITGDVRRTVNLLKAVARGCWVLSKKWIEDSANAGQWLAEEQYEVIEFSKVVQRSRISRQHFGKQFKLNIFDDCGLIFVSRECSPSHKDLKELIRLCGGSVAITPRSASIVIGPVEDSDIASFSEKWILDSITCGRVKYLPKYILK